MQGLDLYMFTTARRFPNASPAKVIPLEKCGNQYCSCFSRNSQLANDANGVSDLVRHDNVF